MRGPPVLPRLLAALRDGGAMTSWAAGRGLRKSSRDRSHWTMVGAEDRGLVERRGFGPKGGIVWALTAAGRAWLSAREAAEVEEKAS